MGGTPEGEYYDSDESDMEDMDGRKGWSRRKIVCTAAGLIALLVAGAMTNCISRTLTRSWLDSTSASEGYVEGVQGFGGDVLRSNGTHDFKRTVLIVSIDGLRCNRADYLDRGLTPHLLDISKQGLRAKSMRPIFPTLTFPNHWALMTGLYAESHGIVANNFWDPASKEEFHYNQIASCWKPNWWLGEPMWESAEKADIITANLMWPGPPKMMSGASSTYFVPWRDRVPLDEKLDQIISWIDLPLQERPQLIMAYEPSLDQAGHATGPNSKRVNETLIKVDQFARNLHKSLAARNLGSIVDIIFVSDHGMTDTSHPTLVYMDDILGEDGLAEIEHEDGWPAMGLRFSPTADVSKHLERLKEASKVRGKNGDGVEGTKRFSVYTHETMPERYHFRKSERIAPVYVVPEMGYVLTTRAEGDTGMSKGNHGYDNNDPSMHAMFVAHGPFSHDAKILHQRRSVSRRAAASAKDGWHSTGEGAYIMQTFQNVEIYNLVLKLLGAQQHAAPTNGTTGFWDRYL
ncbi:alkaline-phosphatase-like protein [Ephemerocybe angulata]|uniref:Alkaline-phosphatase-like protein n=1 Tax=Ephemerocybe angulata TaxID=980116 RepID=A0A8H6HZ97_9AGAR|nr:alkaline-phosphatase-like protein [Tulosesus angulatus]